MAEVIALTGVCVRFGGVQALDGVSFTVGAGESLSLIGPNGAGKTTVLNAISGFVRPHAGSIVAGGSPPVQLLRAPAHRRASLGIARTFQNSRLFGDMRVLDQVMCGGFGTTRPRPLGTLARGPRFLRDDEALRVEALEMLEALDLADAWARPISALPSGHRKLVDLARALMSRPRLLMLDEIAAGLSGEEKQRLLAFVDARRERDSFALIVIEHDLDFIRAIATRAVVLDHGRPLASGSVDDVLARADVLQAYVGEAVA
ncbi:ABC transporter ATP-binding protein [Conexibacter sp. CPCC 206217]|uniref:ABC transporter ATP-binding protein n=1 Tax=Conexibacter sp. CPCC 206217 TaxID=3064574 RepID=UPI0027199B78|nr:ATP-binding cassette domain-containing protein [Conexibacter sp. CPCC 206217]MDO8211098.1 ATP-binding cassette domain-containing protein [Conexibacter sp. CPCC 206217]